MIIATFAEGQKQTRKYGLCQYDYGQKIKIYGLEYLPASNLMFEFIKGGKQIDMLGTKDEEGAFSVDIPDEFIQEAGNIILYCFYQTELEGKTERSIILDVWQRERHDPDQDIKIHDFLGQVLDELAAMQEEIDNWEVSPEQMEQIIAEAVIRVEDFIGNNYYTKDETDNIIDPINNKLDQMTLDNAEIGQVLGYNGSGWVPTTDKSSEAYLDEDDPENLIINFTVG